MLKPDVYTLKQLKNAKGSIFLVDSFCNGRTNKHIKDTFEYLVKKGELKSFYRFYMFDDPGKYVDFDSLNDVPYDESVYYPPTGEKIFIPRYGEPDKFYYWTADEEWVKKEVEIHADTL